LKKARLLPAMAFAAVVGGAAVAVAGIIPVLAVAVAMFVIGGIGNGVQTVSMRSIIVHRVQDRYRGRVFAAYGGLMNGMQLAATGAAGVLVGALGGRTALIIGGVGTAIAGASGLVAYATLPAAVREMPEGQPAGEDVAASLEPEPQMQPEPQTEPEVIEPAMTDDAIGEATVQPIDAMHPMPERPDVTTLPESEPLVERVAER
jgi:MFS family permease